MKFTNQNIAETVEDIREFFKRVGTSEKDVLKICLVLEESLLRYQERFGESQDFEVYRRKWFRAPEIILRINGEPFNPLKNDSESLFSNAALKNLLHYEDAKTTYRYENGCNEIIFTAPLELRKRKIPGGSITVAIFLAIISSFVVRYLPQDVQPILLNDILAPVLSTLMGLIVTVTLFMMFFSIVSSICAIESTTTLSNIGVPVIKRFFFLDLCIVALTVFVSQSFFPVLALEGAKSFEAGKLVELILSIIPKNVFDAFLKCNILQVAILAFFIGFCIITLGNRVPNIKALAEEFNRLMFKIMDIVFSIMPAIIFLCIFKSLATSSLSEAISVWKIIAANCIAYAAFAVIMLAMLRLKTSENISAFVKKILPAFVVSLTTGSSSAALPKTLEVSKINLRVNEKFCDFWVPLSLVLFSPSKLIQLTVSAFYVTSMVQGDNISGYELIVVAFLAMQMSISTPNAGGGIAASFSIMLTQLGLPLEYIGALMMADVVTGNLFTALNVIVRECELVTFAKKMKFIDGA